MARDDGWMAEHMLILGVTPPDGEKKYVAAAFPSACGKTNMAMLIPTLPGWKVETVGDDIAWMKFGDDGRLYAINPEAGFFGVAPGHLRQDQPQRHGDAVRQLASSPTAPAPTTATCGGRSMTDEPPAHLIDWKGQDWTPDVRAPRPPTPTPGSPPRRRSARRSPPSGRTPPGVPISAILFGGRRATNVPLVTESFDWQHGVFLGSIMSSEKTAAAAGTVGELRFDPFAMLPFCGYNMGDYFAHWLEIGRRAEPTHADKLPKLFWVNWFRKDDDGTFLWPGYGENSRVLKWVVERVAGGGEAVETAIGRVPTVDAIDRTGLDSTTRRWPAPGRRRRGVARRGPPDRGATSSSSASSLPTELRDELNKLEKRLAD